MVEKHNHDAILALVRRRMRSGHAGPILAYLWPYHNGGLVGDDDLCYHRVIGS